MSKRRQKQVTIKGLSPQRSITRVQRGLVRQPSPTQRIVNKSDNLSNLDSTIKEKFGSSTTLTSLDYGTLHYSGYLMKLGKNKCWQRRLFRLEAGILTCYRTQRSQLLNHPQNGRVSSPNASATSLTCVAFKIHVPKWQLPLEDVVDIRLLQNSNKDKNNSWFNLKMSRSFVITSTQGEHHILRCNGSMDLFRWLFTLTSQWPLYKYAASKNNCNQNQVDTNIVVNEAVETGTSKKNKEGISGRRRSRTLDNMRPKPTFMLQEDSYKNAFVEAWYQTLDNLNSNSPISNSQLLERNDSTGSNLETALLAKAHLNYMDPELNKFTLSDHAKLERGESPIVPLNGVDPLDLLSLAIEAYKGNPDSNLVGKVESPKIKLMESTQLKPNFQPPLNDVSRNVEIVGFKESGNNNPVGVKQSTNNSGIKLKLKPLPFVEHSTKPKKPHTKTKLDSIKLTTTESTSPTTSNSSSSASSNASVMSQNVSSHNLPRSLRVQRSETNLKSTSKLNNSSVNFNASMSAINLNNQLKVARRPSDPEKRYNTGIKDMQHPSIHRRNLSDNPQLSSRNLHMNGAPLLNKIDEKRSDQIARMKMNQSHTGTNHKSPYILNSSSTVNMATFNTPHFNCTNPNFHPNLIPGMLPHQHQRSKSLEDKLTPTTNKNHAGFNTHSRNPTISNNGKVNQYVYPTNYQNNLNVSSSTNLMFLQQKMNLPTNNLNFYNTYKPMKGTGGSSSSRNLNFNAAGGGSTTKNNVMFNAGMQANFTP